MLKTQRNFGDKSGLGFNKKMTKQKKKRKENEEGNTREALSFHVVSLP